MRPYFMQFVVAPLFLAIAIFQLTLATLNGATYFICTRSCTSLDEVRRVDDPFLFYVTLAQAVTFLAWAGWIYLTEGRGKD